MFIPWIIAILLGLASPATKSTNQCNGGGTVQVTSEEGDPVDPGDPGDPGDDGTVGGTGGGGTGGDTGQTPPPKP